MSEEAAFLRHLQDNADNLAAALVYADWLDDRGNSDRTAFLRLQHAVIEMAHGQQGLLTRSRRLLRLGRLSRCRPAPPAA